MRCLQVILTTGEELIVYSVNDSKEEALQHLMIADGAWVHADVKGHGPGDLWINTAQIVSIKEVD